jgi:hypothetical protein
MMKKRISFLFVSVLFIIFSFQYVDAASLKITSAKLSTKQAYIGNSVKITVNTSGGSGSKKYKYYYKLNKKTYTIKNYCTSKSVSFKPTKSGTYTVYVSVKDNKKTITKSVKLTVYKPISSKVKLSSTYLKVNSNLKITASATSGKGTKQYKYVIYKDNKAIKTQNYSTKTTFNYKPTSKGTYTLKVTTKDQYKCSQTITKYFSVYKTPLNLKLTYNTSVYLGQTETIKASATGGVGAYQYQFAKKVGDKEEIVQKYSSNNSYSYTVNDSNDFTYCVYVKDNNQTVKHTIGISNKGIDLQVKNLNLTIGSLSNAFTTHAKYTSANVSLSNTRICKIDKYYQIIPLKEGNITATVTLKYNDYSITKDFTITVNKNDNVLVGTDLSHHQTSDMTIETLKSNNFDFVILRVSDGTTLDKLFTSRVSECQKLSMNYGVYILAQATTTDEAKKEADFVYNQLQSTNSLNNSSFSLPIYYDLESSKIRSLSNDTIDNIYKAFKDELKKKGYSGDVGIYANNDWLKNKLTGTNVKNAILWQAHYNVNSPTTIYKKAKIWQTGDSYKLKNSAGNMEYIDINYLYKE